jgi:hypothetical protein
MSRGAGAIERRIGELLAANQDRALSVDEIARHAFGLDERRASRAQRLSATRAAHRLLRRRREAAWGGEHGFWCATTVGKGRGATLWFHPRDLPVQVWAVTIDRGGVHWFEAEVVKVTERNVMVSYAGEVARLDRVKLLCWWAWWRGVRFVLSRTGRIAAELEALWRKRYGATRAVPPSMQTPLAEAISLLGVPVDYTRDDVLTAFRRAVKKAHPDLGGTAEQFRKLVEARERLLAALGASEPAPKMPAYYAKGATIVYRRRSRGSRIRLGYATRLALC